MLIISLGLYIHFIYPTEMTKNGNDYEVFFTPKSIKDDLWEALRENDRVSFHLGFSYSGPVTINITPT
jgi:cold shock CspA family protein